MSEEEKTAKVEEKEIKEPEQKESKAAKVEEKKVSTEGLDNPDGALDLIKKLRKESDEKQKELDKLLKEKTEREKDELSAIEKAELERDEFEEKYKETNAELEQVKLNNLKREIAEGVGLPPAFAQRITGATPEEMEADAKVLLDAMPKQAKISTTSPGPNAFVSTNETDAERRKRLGLG